MPFLYTPIFTVGSHARILADWLAIVSAAVIHWLVLNPLIFIVGPFMEENVLRVKIEMHSHNLHDAPLDLPFDRAVVP